MEDKLHKLPKWAIELVTNLQHRIKRLERANTMLAKQYPPSDTVVMPNLAEGRREFYLPSGQRVEFRGNETKVTVYCNLDGYVVVDIEKGVIVPQARNVFFVLDQNNKKNW